MKKLILALVIASTVGCATAPNCTVEAQSWKQTKNAHLDDILSTTKVMEEGDEGAKRGAQAWLKYSKGIVSYAAELRETKCKKETLAE